MTEDEKDVQKKDEYSVLSGGGEDGKCDDPKILNSKNTLLSGGGDDGRCFPKR